MTTETITDNRSNRKELEGPQEFEPGTAATGPGAIPRRVGAVRRARYADRKLRHLVPEVLPGSAADADCEGVRAGTDDLKGGPERRSEVRPPPFEGAQQTRRATRLSEMSQGGFRRRNSAHVGSTHGTTCRPFLR